MAAFTEDSTSLTVPENSGALTIAAAPSATPAATASNSTNVDASANTLSATATAVDALSSTPAAAAAMPNPAPNGSPPDSYNSMFGKGLGINVPSEAPSFVTFQVAGLPTNGTVVLPDGTAPVSVGESLTPAPTAGAVAIAPLFSDTASEVESSVKVAI